MREQVLHSLKWVAIGKLIGQSIRWLTTIFTLRLLFPEDYTVIALGTFFSSLLWGISTGGISSALIREKELDTEKIKQFFTFMIAAHVFFFILIQIAAPYISTFYKNPSVESALRVTSFSFLIVLIGITQQSYLNREMKFKKLSLIDAVSESIGSISTLAMAYFGYGFWAIIYGNLITNCFKHFSYVMATRLIVWPAKITSAISEMMSFSKRASFHGALAHLTNNIDIAIAGAVMIAYDVGIYQFAIVVAMMPASKALPLLRQVAFPAYSKLQDDIEARNRYFLKSMRLAYFLFVPVFWGLSAVSLVAVPVIFGDKWTEAAMVMLVYCLSMPFRSGYQLFAPLLKSANNLQVMISNMFITIAIMVPCFYFIGDSPVNMAFAWLVGYSICYVITTIRSCKVLGLSVKDLLMSSLHPCLAGALMFMLVFGAGEWMSTMDYPAILTLCAQILIGALSYAGVMYILNKSVVFESISLIKRKQ